MTDRHSEEPAMRFDATQLLREPAGTHTDIELDLGHQRLSDDLSVNAVKGRLTLWRTEKEVLVRGTLFVDIDLECGRCLSPTPTTLPIEVEERFRPASADIQPDEQVFPIDADNQLDLRPALQDLTVLSVPMHVVCRPDCAGLCPVCGQDLNKGSCDCETQEIDPRLVALKALIE
jgi:uncharacterized protein